MGTFFACAECSLVSAVRTQYSLDPPLRVAAASPARYAMLELLIGIVMLP